MQQVEKSLGHPPEELQQPPFPDRMAHLWQVFLDLHHGRMYSMGEPCPLTYESMTAWCSLTGIELSPWDVDVVKALDRVWMETMQGADDGS